MWRGILLATEIAFIDDHIENIRSGEKRSTMRTIKRKNLYPVNGIVRVKGTEMLLRIESREILRLGPDGVAYFDDGTFSPPLFCFDRPPMEVLADWEGFENADEMIDWLQGGNQWGVEYDLPQPFSLYVFEEIHKEITITTEWFDGRKKPVIVRARGPYFSTDEIDTLEGDFEANDAYIEEHGGYYSIRGVEGEVYPCAANIFEKTYERVEKGENTSMEEGDSRGE